MLLTSSYIMWLWTCPNQFWYLLAWNRPIRSENRGGAVLRTPSNTLACFCPDFRSVWEIFEGPFEKILHNLKVMPFFFHIGLGLCLNGIASPSTTVSSFTLYFYIHWAMDWTYAFLVPCFPAFFDLMTSLDQKGLTMIFLVKVSPFQASVEWFLIPDQIAKILFWPIKKRYSDSCCCM